MPMPAARLFIPRWQMKTLALPNYSGRPADIRNIAYVEAVFIAESPTPCTGGLDSILPPWRGVEHSKIHTILASGGASTHPFGRQLVSFSAGFRNIERIIEKALFPTWPETRTVHRVLRDGTCDWKPHPKVFAPIPLWEAAGLPFSKQVMRTGSLPIENSDGSSGDGGTGFWGKNPEIFGGRLHHLHHYPPGWELSTLLATSSPSYSSEFSYALPTTSTRVNGAEVRETSSPSPLHSSLWEKSGLTFGKGHSRSAGRVIEGPGSFHQQEMVLHAIRGRSERPDAKTFFALWPSSLNVLELNPRQAPFYHTTTEPHSTGPSEKTKNNLCRVYSSHCKLRPKHPNVDEVFEESCGAPQGLRYAKRSALAWDRVVVFMCGPAASITRPPPLRAWGETASLQQQPEKKQAVGPLKPHAHSFLDNLQSNLTTPTTPGSVLIRDKFNFARFKWEPDRGMEGPSFAADIRGPHTINSPRRNARLRECYVHRQPFRTTVTKHSGL
ncbi:hypothetical protein C8R47DRAFT_1204103 [Mycena vitilis]|nr:hypothetical protein C8R47DRAFT_1204103 [Mycena vitilis]